MAHGVNLKEQVLVVFQMAINLVVSHQVGQLDIPLEAIDGALHEVHLSLLLGLKGFQFRLVDLRVLQLGQQRGQ